MCYFIPVKTEKISIGRWNASSASSTKPAWCANCATGNSFHEAFREASFGYSKSAVHSTSKGSGRNLIFLFPWKHKSAGLFVAADFFTLRRSSNNCILAEPIPCLRMPFKISSITCDWKKLFGPHIDGLRKGFAGFGFCLAGIRLQAHQKGSVFGYPSWIVSLVDGGISNRSVNRGSLASNRITNSCSRPSRFRKPFG